MSEHVIELISMHSYDIIGFVLRLIIACTLDRENETAREDVSIRGDTFFEDRSECSTLGQSLYLNFLASSISLSLA